MTKTREQCYRELKEKHPNIDELDKSPHINIESLIDAMMKLDSAEFKSRPIVAWDKRSRAGEW